MKITGQARWRQSRVFDDQLILAVPVSHESEDRTVEVSVSFNGFTQQVQAAALVTKDKPQGKALPNPKAKKEPEPELPTEDLKAHHADAVMATVERLRAKITKLARDVGDEDEAARAFVRGVRAELAQILKDAKS